MNEITGKIITLPGKPEKSPMKPPSATDNQFFPRTQEIRDEEAGPQEGQENGAPNENGVPSPKKRANSQSSIDLNSPMSKNISKRGGHIDMTLTSSKALDKLLEIEAWNVKEWTEVHISENIQVYKIKEEGSPVILIKAYAFLENIPPEKVFRLIYDLDIRNTWDTTLHNLRIFDKINDNVDHMYSLFKAPGIGVSDRDFCQKRTKSMGYKGTSFIIHFESVDHPECPPLKKAVRAHTSISGYIIRPSQKKLGSSEMTIMTQTDIKVLAV